MNSPPPKPGNAFLSQGKLHLLATVEDHHIWWDEGDHGYLAYLVQAPFRPTGYWIDLREELPRMPSEVIRFIRNHASL